MFIRNQWYVAAWSQDVGRALLGRVLLGEYVVIYRTVAGEVVALENRCPHRNLPLSEGRLVEDRIQCGYHGLEFATSGECVHAPGEDAAPGWACVRTFPTAERHGWVFVWMGDPAFAPRTPVPEFHRRIDDPDWISVTGQTHVKAGYRLVLDNLLDLSHLAFVHASTTGNAEVAEKADVEVANLSADRVRVTRSMRDIPPARAFVEYGGYASNIDRWQVSTFIPPSYILINNGSLPAGTIPSGMDEAEVQGQWGFQVYQAMSPETDLTTHQFWSVTTRREHMTDERFEKYANGMRNVLAEDLAIYEAQQRCIALDPQARNSDVNPKGALKADQGLIRARVILRKLESAEENARATPKPDAGTANGSRFQR